METKTNYKDAEKEKACSNPLCDCLTKAKEDDGEEMYDTPELEELRKQRNEYRNKYEECDNQINKMIAEMHDVPDFVGKWVKVPREEQIDIMHIVSIEKLNFGLRVNHDVAFVDNANINGREILVSYFMDEGYDYIYWRDIDKVQILTSTESDALERLVYKVKDTIHDITSTQHI